MKLLLRCVLITMVALPVHAGFPASKKDLPYYVMDSDNCKTSMWLVNEKPTTEELEARFSRSYVHVDDVWFQSDASKWSSGCLKTRSKEKEDLAFVNAIKKYGKKLEFLVAKKKLTRDLNYNSDKLKITQDALKRIANRSKKVNSIFAKLRQCETYAQHGGEKFYGLTRVKENMELFFVGLCLNLKDHEIERISSSQMRVEISGLPMNGEAGIAFYLKPNSKGVWAPYKYKNYYAGEGYKVSTVWKKAATEAALIGSQEFGQDLYAFKQSRGARVRLEKDLKEYKQKVNLGQAELDKLISSSTF